MVPEVRMHDRIVTPTVHLPDLSAIGPMAAAGTRTAGRQSLLQSPTKLRCDLSPMCQGWLRNRV